MGPGKKNAELEILSGLIDQGKEIPRIPPAVFEKPLDFLAALQAEAPGKIIFFVQLVATVFFCPWPGGG
jgi:hypothetical protein